jgi:PAS domain S-box-containing protein
VALDRIADLARAATGASFAACTVGATSEYASADGVAAPPEVMCRLDDALRDAEAPVTWDDLARLDPDLAHATGWQSVAYAPVQGAGNQRIGYIWVASSCPDHFGVQPPKRLIALAELLEASLHAASISSFHPVKSEARPREYGLVVTSPEGDILWVNRGFENLCGYPLDELVGRRTRTLLHGPDTDEGTARQMGAYMRAGSGFEAELVNYRKSGEPYRVRIQAEPITDKQDNVAGFIALETDVSAAPQEDGAWSLEHDLLTAAIDTVEAPIVILDAEGRIIRFNQASATLTGYAPDDVIGACMVDRLVPDEEANRVRAHLDAQRTSQAKDTFTCHWILRDGSRRLIQWSNTVVSDASGTARYMVATGIDITEQRNLEHELMQASTAERRRIGQDLHDILASHLAGTAMIAQSLSQKRSRDEPISSEDLDLIVDHIHEAAQQTRALSHSLLIPRIEGRQLDTALRQLAENKQELTGVCHEVNAQMDGARVDDRAARHLYRIAYEAINNAIKHGQPEHITVTMRASDGQLLLVVEDDGVGMEPGDATDNGMGLRMMQHRTNLIDGTLEVEPVDAGGTRVRCVVPLGGENSISEEEH